MLLNYKSTIPDRKILKYLRNQSVFKDATTIYNALRNSESNRTVLEGQLAMLVSKHKILAVKMKDRFVYGMPEKLKSGKILSGAIDSSTYLMLTCRVN